MNDPRTTDPTSTPDSTRAPALTRRRLLQAGAGVVALGAGAAGVDAVRGGNGSFGLLGADAAPIGPHSPEVLAAERARSRSGQLVRRTLTARPGTVDLAGQSARTWLFDEAMPAGEIRLKAGDELQVDVDNQLPDPTTVHWHGLALRNDMDGVPGLTMKAIEPGGSFRYQFTAPHPGTYWFHPHVGIQLDTGLIGALIIEDPDEPLSYDRDVTLVLEAKNGMAGGGMGMGGSGSMGGMGGASSDEPLGQDTGDVDYPMHLVNGKPGQDPWVLEAKPRERIRLRLINAGADTAYRFAVGGHRLNVVASDGYPVQPVEVDTLILGMGERYDVILTVQDGAFPILARPEGKQDPDAFAVLRSSSAADTPLATAAALDGRMLAYADLAPTDAVALSPRKPDRILDLSLALRNGGKQWVINGKTYADRVPLEIKQDERVRLRLSNHSMMFHPMHLHGHSFAVVQDGRAGVRKDTVNVLPMQRVDVDLVADNPGQWMLHCHNAYHAELGMMTVVSYVR